jgi:hypothetical protein
MEGVKMMNDELYKKSMNEFFESLLEKAEYLIEVIKENGFEVELKIHPKGNVLIKGTPMDFSPPSDCTVYTSGYIRFHSIFRAFEYLLKKALIKHHSKIPMPKSMMNGGS